MIKQSGDRDELLADPALLELCVSPVRDAIVQVVLNQGEASVATIAEQLGRKAASLYRHIESLVEAGLLQSIGEEAAGTRSAVVYAAHPSVGTIPYMPEDSEHTHVLARYAAARLRHAGKELGAAYLSGDAQSNGAERDTVLYDVFGWLDNAQRATLNEHLDAIYELFTRADRREGTRLVSVTAALRPTGDPGNRDA